MKQLITLAIILMLSSLHLNAQVVKQKIRGPIWITDDKNTDVIGLSLAAYPKGLFQGEETPLSRTFGVKLELFPLSPLFFLAPSSPLSNSDISFQKVLEADVNEKIYGFNIETGNFSSKDVYGISITGIIHYSRKNNGISAAGLSNFIERANGIVMAFGGNSVYKGNGVLIAGPFGNASTHFNGLAIGFGGNEIEKFSGVMIGGPFNNKASFLKGVQIGGENYIINRGRGLQIGIFNSAKNFKGIQLGLWNKNDKRALPFLNWQFSN